MTQLRQVILIISILLLVLSPKARAEISRDRQPQQIKQRSLPSLTPNTPTQIIGVQLNTDAEIEVLLTPSQQLQPVITSVLGNTYIVEIPNAVLVLADGEEFRTQEPSAEIAEVTVTNLPNNRVQVAITGVNEPPTVTISSDRQRLVLSVTPPPPTAEEIIEILVTGEQVQGYIVPNASTATRTDTPLRDIPQSIQVIPQQVLEDQQVIRLDEALRNVSGVVPGDNFAGTRDQFIIRGFPQFNTFRDGVRDSRNILQETTNIERIEVLKGPASVLFGNLEPGGIVNIIPKRPLRDPFYAAEVQVGNFGLIRPQIDVSEPLNAERSLYRLNVAYERAQGFRDFEQDIERVFIAPVFSWAISDRTNLLLEFEYLRDERPFDRGLVAIGDTIADIPIDRILGEPDDFRRNEAVSAGYALEHRLSENWQIRNAFRFSASDTLDFKADPDSLDETTGNLSRTFSSNDDLRETYELQTALLGQFTTGEIAHQVVFGVDLARVFSQGTNFLLPEGETPSINIFAPVYDAIARPTLNDLTELGRDSRSQVDSLGIYLQDQVSILDNLKLLVGGRFDIVEQDSVFNDSPSARRDDVFSPRFGLVYQPINPISLYASYSQSFAPNFGTTADGTPLEPERGTQYEIGVRAELLEGRLISNLAFYELTKTNIATSDPNDPTFNFYIPIGEQRSRGIELDIGGEILPGWNVIASYAYTDAVITSGTFGIPDGNLPANVPQHSGSLWTTYEIQRGNLQGLGFGLGLFLVGARQGDNENTFELPSYLRTDAAVYYRQDNWRLALNLRNLFDVAYFESVEYGRTTIKPGAPFTVVGSIAIEF
ncbi:TonB-dependent siderophore receptor [Chroogloeocystis siderophila]|jgi:iron complex outermembrane receptor protein|uniref:Ferrichrome-iron receptor n=1 Tax=Chroogloeocystis siderophila 5.2 s.c.1 TaxID=247279 RepID=A0A1U7HTR9_9CHRO|nr:TonB-dependent receptor [Chroogloeocystis siderophila]OKH27000.1 ferrichrome-iron receptor [Chroogloeocystis siderophila 5.2 s.c.1]